MIIEYIKPINGNYDKALLLAATALKDLKKQVIIKTIEKFTEIPFQFNKVVPDINYTYSAKGIHYCRLGETPLIKFLPSTYDTNDKDEIVCSFEYIEIHNKARRCKDVYSSAVFL